MKHAPLATLAVFLTFTLSATPALAYLDPGTGSMILQGIIAGIAALSLTLKMYWHRFKAFFSRKGGNENSAEGMEAMEGAEEESKGS